MVLQSYIRSVTEAPKESVVSVIVTAERPIDAEQTNLGEKGGQGSLTDVNVKSYRTSSHGTENDASNFKGKRLSCVLRARCSKAKRHCRDTDSDDPVTRTLLIHA